MGVSASASGYPLSARPGALPLDRDAATGHQQRPGADKQRDKAQVEGSADIPSTASPVRLTARSTVFQIAGRKADSLRTGRYTNFLDTTDRAVMCEQDEIWQESWYISEAKMGEVDNEGRTRGIDGKVDWTRLEAEARKMIESGLELTDRIEAA